MALLKYSDQFYWSKNAKLEKSFNCVNNMAYSTFTRVTFDFYQSISGLQRDYMDFIFNENFASTFFHKIRIQVFDWNLGSNLLSKRKFIWTYYEKNVFA